MGAWGEGIFECDSAEEWVEQLTSQTRTAMVRKPLTVIVKAKKGAVLEADQCTMALAAAEVMAAALGHPCRGLPKEVVQWLDQRGFGPSPSDSKLADDAIARIAASSELGNLWENSRTWTIGLKNLSERLKRPPKPLKPTPPVATRSKSTPAKATQSDSGAKSTGNSSTAVKLSEIRKIVKQRKGGLAMIGGKANYLGFEGAIVRDLIAIGNCPDLQTLKSLEICGRGISDRGLESIAQLVNLQVLELDAPNVTDAGMACLATMVNLKVLDIRRSQVTDAGLEHLVALKSLKNLSIDKSAITASGLKKLSKRLGCEVFSDVLE